MLCHLNAHVLILCILKAEGLPDLEGRIIEGYDAEIEKFPHAVFLYFKKSIPKACVGSLVTVNVVLTAAICVDELVYEEGHITAYLGAKVPKDSHAVRQVDYFRIHPRFNREKGKFNLGLLHLHKKVPLGHKIQKVPITPYEKRPQEDDYVFTCGWGKTAVGKKPNLSKADISWMRPLKASKQLVITNKECQIYTGYRMSEVFWCTRTVNGWHHHGDAGSGLVTRDRFLVAVASYVLNDITIYSDVYKEQKWMSKAIQSMAGDYCNG